MESTSSKIEFVDFDSTVLKNNPLGDPSRRKFPVYLPPNYDAKKKYPVIYGLPGFSGFGDSYIYKRTFSQSMPEIFDELITQKGVAPFIYVMPTCLTRYGGSQYINSSATGNYEDYIVKELVPLIDKTFSTNQKRAIMGGSSGGIGSYTLAAKNPNVFCAVANHSGDSAFEYAYLSDVPKFVSYMEKFDYDLKKFIARIEDPELIKNSSFNATINLMCMFACYLPNPKSELGFDVPFDLKDGELNIDLWEKLLQHDPVVFSEKYTDNLKKLHYIYIDCGKRDQFHLYLGARRLHKVLGHLDVPHEFVEYDSDHFLMRRNMKKKSITALMKVLSN